MFRELILPGLCVLGPSYLGMMAIAYLIPPSRHHLIHRTPPGIISLTYTGLTAVSLAFGTSFIISDNFLKFANDVSMANFNAGKAEIQGNILVIAIFVSSCFILGNLLRSYFNLHRIEESPVQDDHFTIFISSLNGNSRWIEFSFRTVIFITILFIEYKIASLNNIINPNYLTTLTPNGFLTTFNLIWKYAFVLYCALLLWDFYLFLCLKNGGKEACKVTIRQAFPVHLCGLIVASCIILSSYVADISPQLTGFALIVSIIGIVLLFISLYNDRRLIIDTFRVQA